MSLKCRKRIFVVTLVLFLYDICISFANEISNMKDNGINSKELATPALENGDLSDNNNGKVDVNQTATMDLKNKVITFQIEKALNVNLSDIKVDNGISFFHSDDEYLVLYNKFIRQNVRLNMPQRVVSVQDDHDDSIQETYLKLSSLYYYNDNNWGCTINNRFIKNGNQDKAHNNVSIVKVNKDNILFILKRTKEEDIEKIRKLKKSDYKYRSDYYIVKSGKMRSVMFRLYIGQSINLTSFIIQQ